MINYLLFLHRFIIFIFLSFTIILDNYKNRCESSCVLYHFSFEAEVENKLIKQRLSFAKIVYLINLIETHSNCIKLFFWIFFKSRFHDGATFGVPYDSFYVVLFI